MQEDFSGSTHACNRGDTGLVDFPLNTFLSSGTPMSPNLWDLSLAIIQLYVGGGGGRDQQHPATMT